MPRHKSTSKKGSKQPRTILGDMLGLAAKGLSELEKEGGGTRKYLIKSAPVAHPRTMTTEMEGEVTLRKIVRGGRSVATIKIVDFSATFEG